MKIHGKGSVVMAESGKSHKTCRHWFLRVSTDHGPKQRRFSGTYSQAQKELEHYKASLLITPDDMTFGDIANKWLERRRKLDEVASTTAAKDEREVRKLIKEFGKVKLADLTRDCAWDGLLEIKERENLGNTYLGNIYYKMKAILKEAVIDGNLAKSPLEGTKAPKPERTKRRALSEDELFRFFEVLNMVPLDSHTIGVRIAVLEGLRRGEIVGLNWDDVDTINLVVHVRRSITEKQEEKEPKTEAGVRDVPMVHQLVKPLDDWRAIQERQLRVLGIKQTLNTPVLTSTAGTRLHPQNLERWWRTNRADLGLPNVVLHELRHTFLTMVAENGASMVELQRIAGWDDINMANTYIHRDRTVSRDAIDALERGLEGIV